MKDVEELIELAHNRTPCAHAAAVETRGSARL
jgi:hypothetical protein